MRRPINPAWRQASLPGGAESPSTARPSALGATVVSDRANEPAFDSDDLRHLPGFGGGRYAIGRELGRGGMGVVYQADDKVAGHPVALKVLAGDMTDQEVVDRFLVEAKIGLALVDEHVCRLYDVGVDAITKRPFMAMELLQGRDLDTLVDAYQGRTPLAEACEHVMAACAGLATAHAMGVVHRDVKLSNLFLAETGGGTTTLKVLDFGVSKAPGFGDVTRMTKTGEIMGSPFYMAPEQVRNAKSVDARADVWSLGVALYELLCGELPFASLSATQLFAAILTLPHVPIGQERSDLPPAIGDIIDVALHKDRDRRFASVVALARALAPYTPRGADLLERVRARAAAGTGEPPPRTSR